MSIRPLASEVIDQIAAGEVVERPAHLVKELVENALDAGARSIEIEFDQGGRRLRVTDDGCGIPKDELLLALARHATSKIADASDIWRLSTFGFRGEALASAAAVSRLTLLSKSRDAQGAPAARVTSEFGKLSAPEETSGNDGTTALVEDLFANLPARLKFLKSEGAESVQIKNVLKAIALARHDVEFRARSRGKTEFSFAAAASSLERAKQALGVKHLYESAGEAGASRARVIFASPHEVSGRSTSIWIFAQGRWVQDRGVQAAVMDAYRGLLMHGEFPIAVVFLETDPEEIDVNIHPSKSQVKFRDPSSAFRAVHRAVREGLEKAPWLANLGAGEGQVGSREHGETRAAGVAQAVQSYSAEAFGSELRRKEVSSEGSDKGQADGPKPFATSSQPLAFAGAGFDDVNFKSSAFVRDLRGSISEPVSQATSDVLAAPSERPALQGGHWSRLQILGQARLTYILAQSKESLVMIDQHAAHERVAYERLMRAWSGGKIETQILLMPLDIVLDSDRAEALMTEARHLEKLGVTVELSGPQTVSVRAKPAAISDAALVQALTRLARDIADRGGSFALEKRIGDLCATLACHSVVRAGQALSFDQMQSLLAQMDEFPLSSFCPHGRPVSIEQPFSKIERDFGRIS